MLIHLAPQGSPEWLAARAGVITASMFRVARSTKRDGTPTAEARKYAFRLALERIGGQPLDEGFETWQMRRGRDLEPEARAAFEAHAGVDVMPAGFITTDDGRFGGSADGFIGDDEGFEAKCLVSPESLMDVLMTNDIGDFIDQCQGGMWITGRRFWNLCVYCPALAPIGRSLTRWCIPRDDAYIAELARDLAAFDGLVRTFEAQLRNPQPMAA